MDLETWLEKNEADLYEMGTVEEIATAAWQAAQAAERERTKELVEAERESSDKPVAWVSCDGYLSHYRLGDEYIPLYRHPPPARKLTDEEINDCFDIAQRSFHKHQSGIKGQQLNIQDWPNWHFARAIEQKIWEKAE